MKWFEICLVVATAMTGFITLLDHLVWAKRRQAKSPLFDKQQPTVIEYARSIFPVVATVLILRTCVVEPYKIPSSSMMPNLMIGDFILVNKFAYGLRLPITNQKIFPIAEPKRGDVVVFKPPQRPDENWIKRIIGLPGDHIRFSGDTLSINGQAMQYIKRGTFVGKNRGAEMNGATLLVEEFPGRPHTELEFLGQYMPEGQGEWTVPPGHYFVMGDNRDNSEDSRFWTKTHFLPEENLRGKAFLVWLNCQGWLCKDGFDLTRIGQRIQ